MRKTMGRLLVGLGLMALSAPAWAGYGNEGALGSFLDQSANWLVTILGPGIFVIGVIMVGISLAMGDQDAMRKGGYVIGGGALIFLSQGVVALLKHQQAFANDYLKTLGSPGKHTVWGGTLAVDYSQAGTTHLVYTRPHLSLPMATMVARTMGGPGLDYGQPTLEEGWVTFPPVGKDKPRVKARIRSTGYGAQSVEVWLQ